MATSFVNYTGDGNTTEFNFSFPYLNTDYVKVYLDGTIASSYTVGASSVVVTPAPDAGVEVLIKRETASEVLVDFVSGATLTEADLDTSFQQALHKAVEASEANIGLSGGAVWDADNRRLVNLADPTNSTDAVNRTYVDTLSLYGSGASVPQAWELTGTGATNTFTLETPDPAGVSNEMFVVSVDGILQAPSSNDLSTIRDFRVTESAGVYSITFETGSFPSNSGSFLWDYPPEDAVINVQNFGIARSFATESSTVKATGSSADRTLGDRFADVVNVKDFGAVGDGVTDDAGSIQAALDSLSSGGELFFPSGVYKITSVVAATFDNGAMVRIKGENATIDGSTITGSVAGDTDMITLGGVRGTGVALSASPVKGDTSISLSYTLSAESNDIILLTSTDLWNSTREYYYSGELVEIADVTSPTEYSLSSPLFDGYTAVNTTAYLLEMPTIVVSGLEFKMNANQRALVVEYSKNPVVENCKVHGARYTGIVLDYCYGGNVKNNDVYDAWYSGTGTSYGIAILTCQGVVTNNNLLREARHCLTTGGEEPARNITYLNNTCTLHPDETSLGSIDAHGNCEFVKILDNFCEGIIVAGINLEIKGNTISGNKDNTFGINIFAEIDSEYYIIKDNILNVTGTQPMGIYFSPAQPDLTFDRVVLEGNEIKSVWRGITFEPRTADDTGCVIEKLIIRNNGVFSGEAQAFLVNETDPAEITVNVLKSRGNIYSASDYDCFQLLTSVDEFYSNSDTFLSNRSSGYNVHVFSDQAIISSAVIKGDSSNNGRSVLLKGSGSGTCKIMDSVIENLTYRAEIQDLTNYVERGNITNLTSLLNTAGARVLHEYVTDSITVSYGSAAPTTGTWVAGDKVYDSTPTAGGTIGWVCTVAGTPGTWKAFGTIAS